MKSKKIIALLVAAALSASSVVALAEGEVNVEDLAGLVKDEVPVADEEELEFAAMEALFAEFDGPGIDVVIDGKKINFDIQPQMKNDRVFVPIRFVLENLGVKVDWIGSEQAVLCTKGNKVVKLWPGSKVIMVDDKKIELDVAPYIVHEGGVSRTLVPLRAISESFGYKVDWIDAYEMVVITTISKEESAAVGEAVTEEAVTEEAVTDISIKETVETETEKSGEVSEEIIEDEEEPEEIVEGAAFGEDPDAEEAEEEVIEEIEEEIEEVEEEIEEEIEEVTEDSGEEGSEETPASEE